MTNIENNMNDNINTTSAETAKEIEVAEREDAAFGEAVSFVLELSKEIEINGAKTKRLYFNFDKLTGEDFLKIENEMGDTLGRMVITPEFSSDFLIRMAARACTEKIGHDILQTLSIRDFNVLRKRCRSFLINAGL